MGIIDSAKRAFSDGVMESCDQDMTTGAISCKRYRKNKDGSEHVIAEGTWQADSKGKAIPVHHYESEKGAFDDLNKSMQARIKVSHVENRPEGY